MQVTKNINYWIRPAVQYTPQTCSWIVQRNGGTNGHKLQGRKQNNASERQVILKHFGIVDRQDFFHLAGDRCTILPVQKWQQHKPMHAFQPQNIQCEYMIQVIQQFGKEYSIVFYLTSTIFMNIFGNQFTLPNYDLHRFVVGLWILI